MCDVTPPTSSLLHARPRFFGCWGIPGHMLYNERGRTPRRDESGVPWTNGELDGSLCPPTDKYAGARKPWPESDEAKQPQGLALIHHRNGWTALAFWDRTGDSRGNSNSVFLLPDTFDFGAALDAAGAAFPSIFERFTFEVRPAEEAVVSR